jgi:hypothetical protein
VFADNILSPLDALTVINALNNPTPRTALPASISSLAAAAVDPVFAQSNGASHQVIPHLGPRYGRPLAT